MKLVSNKVFKSFGILLLLLLFILVVNYKKNSYEQKNGESKIITFESSFSVKDFVFMGEVKKNKPLKKNIDLFKLSSPGHYDLYEALVEIKKVYKGKGLSTNIYLRYGFISERAGTISLFEEGDVQLFALIPYLCDLDRSLLSFRTLVIDHDVLPLNSEKSKAFIAIAEDKSMGIPPIDNSRLDCLIGDKSSYPQI